jgi:hypothetical protein
MEISVDETCANRYTVSESVQRALEARYSLQKKYKNKEENRNMINFYKSHLHVQASCLKSNLIHSYKIIKLVFKESIVFILI